MKLPSSVYIREGHSYKYESMKSREKSGNLMEIYIYFYVYFPYNIYYYIVYVLIFKLI